MNILDSTRVRRLSRWMASRNLRRNPENVGRGMPVSAFRQEQQPAPGALRDPAWRHPQQRAMQAPRFPHNAGRIHLAAGFTLIEILVVVVIIGVLALAVTMSIATAGGERQLTRESERLQALIDHACTEAELTGREIGVRVSRNGYAFSMLGFQGWMASEQKNELRPRTWVPGMQIDLYRDGQEMRLADDESESPQIVCFSSGELSPFVLRLQLGDALNRYEVRGQADGRIAVESVAIRP